MSQKNNRKRKLFWRVILSLFSVFFFLILALLILFQIYRDDIAKEVLNKVNTIQNGELIFEDISFAPFIHFPAMSLELDNVDYYEKKVTFRFSDSIPIIKLHQLYLAFDVIDLIKGNINVSKVLLNNGEIQLLTYADSSLNIINAIGNNVDTTQFDNDSTKTASSEFKVDLDEIVLQNINVKSSSVITNETSLYNINTLVASLNYWPDTIKCKLNSSITIKEKMLAGKYFLKDNIIRLETSMKFGRDSREVIVDPSKITFEQADFKTSGTLYLDKKGWIDLDIAADDKNFSVLNLFLSDEGLDNIRKGDLFLSGNIKGKLFEGIPEIDFSFGISDVVIDIPKTNKQISALNMTGSFKSGEKMDLSDSFLKIDTLRAILPGGGLNCKLNVHNFSVPNFNLDLYLKSDIEGFDRVFDFGGLDSLSGKLELKAEYSGKYDIAQKKILSKKGISLIKFDSISLTIPGINDIKNLYGRLRYELDTLWFTDLNLHVGTSDFNINGHLRNTLNLLFDTDTVIDGNLHINANTYDYPNFFSYDEKIASAFPYKIKNINLFVRPVTTSKQLTEFVKTPAITFNIDHLDAEIEDFLPPVSILNGVFDLGDKDSSLLLNFKEFDISLAGSKLHLTDMIFTSPKVDPDWFTINVDVANLDPKRTFVYWTDDTIPEFMDGQLDGQLDLKMVLSNDSLIDFEKVDLKASKLDYINTKDTFDIYQMRINAKDIAYDLSASSNFLEHLSFDINFTVDTLATNYFKIDKVDDEIVAKDGIFTILPHNSQLFDQRVEGLIILSPYTDPPTYDIKYKVDQFDVATLFETFLEDTVLTGKMDFDLQLTLSGHDWDEIKKNLKGKIDVQGNNLNLIGMNLDKVIERFKRSQRFTFADLGAMFLLGPAGILVTKGADYASLVVLSPGDSSHVRQVSALWMIEDGKIDLSDVAFSTDKNRMAAVGIIDLGADSIDVHFALLNKDGCSIFKQGASGSLEKPKMGKVKVVESLVLAPVTNLAKSIDSKDCDVFYDGRVKQPQKKKEKEKENSD